MASYSILFHGNCIDGWFSAYLMYKYLQTLQGSVNSNIDMYPISPKLKHTWPHENKLKGRNVILLDTSVPYAVRQKWLKNGGACCIYCIDHHSTSVDQWSRCNKDNHRAHINVGKCTAMLVWELYYGGQQMPLWLYSIDRVDRWDNPTYSDRCLKEILHVISLLPTRQKIDEAFTLTDTFIANFNNEVTLNEMMMKGKQYLDNKIGALNALLTKGKFVTIDENMIAQFNLPNEWLNTLLYIIDTTDVAIDSTEASHHVFTNYTNCKMFINYRFSAKSSSYTYSARSIGVDLTQYNFFKGHPNSAGGHAGIGDVVPFVSIGENVLAAQQRVSEAALC